MGEDTSERSERAATPDLPGATTPLEGLTEQQRGFVEAVALQGVSQTEASKRAGYGVKNHASHGSDVASIPKVRAAIAALRAEAVRTGGYTLAHAVREVREFGKPLSAHLVCRTNPNSRFQTEADPIARDVR